MCNCSSNPCSCANANCSCPPDYSIAPAKLNCQGTPCDDTLPTSCIFTSSYLSCTNQQIGTDLQTVLNAMDTKICQCVSCSGNTDIPLYYVDSNNPNNGDGSVVNPFKSLDLAKAAIIAVSATNITVQVASGTYTTSQNIYIPSITWSFAKGANVTFTGAGTYFIDSTSFSIGSSPFYIIGDIVFNTSTGGFVKSSGVADSSNPNKNIFIECFSASSTTPFSAGSVPMISCDASTPSMRTVPPSLSIRLRGQQSSLSSVYQNTVYFAGAYLFIDLQGGTISYNGGGTSFVVFYNVNDTNPQVGFRLENGFIYSYVSAQTPAMIYFVGNYNYIFIDNIKTINPGISLTKPDHVITIASGFTMQSLLSTNIFTFLLRNLYINRDCVNTTTSILYSASGGSDIFYSLEMQNCVLAEYCNISPAPNILPYLGKITSGSVAKVCINVINGLAHMTNLPASNPGSGSGYIWNNSGVVSIA